MSSRRFRVMWSAVPVMTALCVVPIQAAGQPVGGPPQPAAAADWTPPLTPDGQPDIQGVWVNFDRTPLEVPNAEDAARL